jgi:hypothetical protein
MDAELQIDFERSMTTKQKRLKKVRSGIFSCRAMKPPGAQALGISWMFSAEILQTFIACLQFLSQIVPASTTSLHQTLHYNKRDNSQAKKLSQYMTIPWFFNHFRYPDHQRKEC